MRFRLPSTIPNWYKDFSLYVVFIARYNIVKSVKKWTKTIEVLSDPPKSKISDFNKVQAGQYFTILVPVQFFIPSSSCNLSSLKF